MEPIQHDQRDTHSAQEMDGTSLEDYLGPFYTREAVTSRLGITTEELSAMITEKRLLELSAEDEASVFPAWQFEQDMQPRPWLSQVITLLSEWRGTDSTLVALWIKGFEKVDLGGMTVDQWLTSGGDIEDMFREARHDVERWSH